MNKFLLLSVFALLFLAGCIGQPTEITPTTTTTPTETTTTETTTPPTTAVTQITTTTTTPSPKTVDVTIQNFAFSPTTITINVGDTMRWTNKDGVSHSATADDGSFDTGVFGQGVSRTITFDKTGTYDYHCTPHPYMKAKVIVQ